MKGMVNISISRKEREKEFRKELIADAAQLLFAQNSYDTVTVEDIAKKAEFGKATIYQYFSGKEDLLVYILCRIINEVCDEIEDKCLDDPDPQNSLGNLVEVYYAHLKDYISLYISFVKLQLDGVLAEELILQVNNTHAKKVDLMKEIIEKGITAGVIINKDSTVLTRALDSTIKGFNFPFFQVEGNSSEEDVKLVKTIVFSGMLNKENLPRI